MLRWRLPLIALVIMLFAWRHSSLVPGGGLDQSWIAGLWMGVHGGISFGNHAIFTYGPLGFLTTPTVWYSGLSIALIAYLLITRFTLALLLYVSLRRTFTAPVAFVIAVIVAQPATNQVETVIVLIGLVLAVSTELTPRQLVVVAGASGAFAGFQLLAKLSVFPSIALMTLIFVLTVRGHRRNCAIAALLGAVSVFFVGWFVSGQALSALPDYIRNSAQIASGYSAAMSVSIGGTEWQAAGAVVALAFGLWGVLHMTATAPTRQRWAIALLWLTFWFFVFKEGFVRHDQGHVAVFFGAIVGGFAALRWRWTHRLPAVACIAALMTFFLAAITRPFSSLLHPVANAKNAVNETRDALKPGAVIAKGRRDIRLVEPINPSLLALLAGQSTAPYPTELAVAWAYSLKLSPIPVLQSYSAYTSQLDKVDANFLSSSQAPQRVLLRQEPGVDDRIASFDQGETNRTMLCRYRQSRSAGIFTVLVLSPNRCSAPQPLLTVHADWGQSVAVPQPPDGHSLVFVRIQGVNVSGLERVRALVFKPSERFIAFNSGRFRLVQGTAGDGLPLAASPGYDYSSPFNFAVGAKTIAVLKQGQGATGGKPITFSFYLQRFSAPARLR